MDDVWSAPGNIHNRAGQSGEVAVPKKAVEKPRRITKKLVETVLLSILVFIAVMLPMILTYVPPPESVLRMKELMTQWCTPSICFVFLVVGIMVATSGVLNGAQSRGLHERGDVYQRHDSVVQRDALRMPDIFSVGESVRPLSIPAPAPVPFPVRDFPAVRPLPVYLKRDLSSRFQNDLRGLGKNTSPAPPRFEALGPAKVPATQNLDRESYLLRRRDPGMSNSNGFRNPAMSDSIGFQDPVMSNSNSFQDPVMSNSNSFQAPIMSHSNSFREQPAGRRAPISPVLDDDYIISTDPPAVTSSVPAVQLEVPASPSPAPTSARPFEGPSTPVPTSAHVIDRELPPASPTMPLSDVVTAASLSPALAPIFVQEIPVTTTTCPPIHSTQPSTPAPRTPPPASPPAVRESVLTLSPLALTSPPDSPMDDGSESPVPESPVDSPVATPTTSPPPPPPDSPLATPMASPPPPPPFPPQSPQASLDANVIAPVEVNLSPIVTRKVQRSFSSKTGGSNRSFNESSGRKPPSYPAEHHTGEPMSVPAKGSTSAAQKHEGESYLAMKAEGSQSQKPELTPGVDVSSERQPAASSQNVAGSAVKDLRPADDDVDQRVEAFLANFRLQMRMQRQESLLRHQRGEE